MRPLIGQLFLEGGFVTQEQLDFALSLQKASGRKLGLIVQELGFTDEEAVTRALAFQAGLPYVELDSYPVREGLQQILAGSKALLPMVALYSERTSLGQVLHLAMALPFDEKLLKRIQMRLGMRVVAHVASAGAIRREQSRLNRAFQGRSVEVLVGQLDGIGQGA